MKYTSALCGSGKTHTVIRSIAKNKYKFRGRAILVQPKKQNLIESEAALKSLGMTPQVIDEDHIPVDKHGKKETTVAARLNAYMGPQRTPQAEDVLLVTHASFLHIIRKMRPEIKANYVVIFDETPQNVFGQFQLSLSTNANLITDHIITEESQHEDFFRLAPKDDVEIQIFLTKEGEDEVNDKLRGLFDKLLDDDFRCEIRKDLWNRFLKNKKNSKNNVAFTAHHYMQPTIFSGFKYVHFLSDKFIESDLFHIFQKQGVHFEEQELKVRYSEHKNTTTTHIRYCMERDFSKSKRTNLCKNGKTIIQNILDVSRMNIQDDKTLLVLNKDMIEGDSDLLKSIKIPPNVEIISSYVHGLNEYQDVHHITFAASLNYRDTQSDFLFDRFGISYEDIDRSFLFSSTYQAVCRTSIRNMNDNSFRVITVPDRRSAAYLQEVLGIPDERVKSLEDHMYLYEEKTSGGQKKDHKQTKEMTELKKATKKIIIKECEEFSNFMIDEFSRFRINLLDKTLTTQISNVLDFENPEDILDFFEKESSFTSDDKHTEDRLAWCALINTEASLNPRTGLSTKYGEANNAGYTCLMFDKDTSKTGEDISFTECAAWFKKQNWSFFMYETYSGTGNFRVVLPMTQVITCEAHELLTKWINKSIGNLGFKADENEPGPFDSSKFNAASKFFLPNHKAGTKIKTRRNKGAILNPIKALKSKEVKISDQMAQAKQGQTSHKKKIYERVINPALTAINKTETRSELRNRKSEEAKEKFLQSKGHNELAELVRKMTFWEKSDEILPFVLMNYRNSPDMQRETEGLIRQYASMQTCTQKFGWSE